MIPILDIREFVKDMNNLVKYSEGFLDGARLGQPRLMMNVAQDMKVSIGQYIDTSARVNPAELQHVYEWYATGSPEARLFDINYFVAGNNLSMNATLRQSQTIKHGSNVPFRDKAYVIENGIAVTIKPREGGVLAFEDNGESVFTRKPVVVNNPGGTTAIKGLEKSFKQFFVSYLSQSTIFSSGIADNLRRPVEFSRKLRMGVSYGRSAGISAGKSWIGKESA